MISYVVCHSPCDDGTFPRLSDPMKNEPSIATRRDRRIDLAVAIGLVAVTLAALSPVLTHDFLLYDDTFYVTDARSGSVARARVCQGRCVRCCTRIGAGDPCENIACRGRSDSAFDRR